MTVGGDWIVYHHTFLRVYGRPPGCTFEHPLRILVTCLPPCTDARGREVDVLGVVLGVELRRDKSRDVHRRTAAPGGEFPGMWGIAETGRKLLRKLSDNVAQVVDLLLARDMALGPARELDVLLSSHHLPHRSRLRAFRIPDVHGKDHRIPPRLVVEHRLDWGIRIDAAVPVRLTVDPHSGKRRRQGARRKHVLDAEGFVAAVEIAHLAGI